MEGNSNQELWRERLCCYVLGSSVRRVAGNSRKKKQKWKEPIQEHVILFASDIFVAISKLSLKY